MNKTPAPAILIAITLLAVCKPARSTETMDEWWHRVGLDRSEVHRALRGERPSWMKPEDREEDILYAYGVGHAFGYLYGRIESGGQFLKDRKIGGLDATQIQQNIEPKISDIRTRFSESVKHPGDITWFYSRLVDPKTLVDALNRGFLQGITNAVRFTKSEYARLQHNPMDLADTKEPDNSKPGERALEEESIATRQAITEEAKAQKISDQKAIEVSNVVVRMEPFLDPPPISLPEGHADSLSGSKSQ